MFHRVLLDNDSWRVVIGLFAGVKVTIKARGYSIKATTQERRYLLAVIEELQRLGTPIVPGNETLEWVLDDFANSVADRSSAAWEMFFTLETPIAKARRISAYWHPQGQAGPA